MAGRPYPIVPALPAVGTPIAKDDGQMHPAWRVWSEDISDQLTFNGRDVIYENRIRLDDVDGLGTTLEVFVQDVVDFQTEVEGFDLGAIATRTTALETRLDLFNGTGGTIEAEVGRIDTATVTAQTTADGAVTAANAAASSVATIAARLNDFNGTGLDVEASVSSAQTAAATAQTTADGAVTTANAAAADVTTLEARLDNFAGTGLTAEARVTNVATAATNAQTTADGAVASASTNASNITTLTGRLNNFDGSGNSVEAEVSTTASIALDAQTTADGIQTDLSALYLIRVAAGTNVATLEQYATGNTSGFVFEADEFFFRGSSANTQFVTMSGNKVRFGTDVEIGGDLVIDGTLTVGKAGAGFFGARQDFAYDFTATPQGAGVEFTFTMSTDGYVLIKWKALNDQFNITYRIGTYQSPAGVNPIDEEVEVVNIGSAASGWVYRTTLLNAQVGLNYIRIDPAVESGDTYTRLEGFVVELPIPV